MTGPELPRESIQDVVRRALAEDIGAGDVTTMTVVDARGSAQARIAFRETGIMAGLPLVRESVRAARLGGERGCRGARRIARERRRDRGGRARLDPRHADG